MFHIFHYFYNSFKFEKKKRLYLLMLLMYQEWGTYTPMVDALVTYQGWDNITL